MNVCKGLGGVAKQSDKPSAFKYPAPQMTGASIFIPRKAIILEVRSPQSPHRCKIKTSMHFASR